MLPAVPFLFYPSLNLLKPVVQLRQRVTHAACNTIKIELMLMLQFV